MTDAPNLRALLQKSLDEHSAATRVSAQP